MLGLNLAAFDSESNVLPLTPKEVAAWVRFIQPPVLRLSTE
jgi:hypothetical protein